MSVPVHGLERIGAFASGDIGLHAPMPNIIKVQITPFGDGLLFVLEGISIDGYIGFE
jgi:hypothetical protein